MEINLLLLSEKHGASLVVLLDDATLYTYLDKGKPAKDVLITQVEGWVSRNLVEIDNEIWINWVVCDHRGRVFGHAQATVYTANRAEECWMGWTVAQVQQNKGLGTVMAEMMVKEISSRFPDITMRASVAKGNNASLRLAQKIGMKKEKDLQKDEIWVL